MLIEGATSAVQAAPTNVGLTAFQVAVVQAKAFEKQLIEVGKSREQEASAQEKRQKAHEEDAEGRGGVDIVVGASEEPGGGDPAVAEQADASPKGREVNIEI